MVVSTQQGKVVEPGIATELQGFHMVDLQAIGDPAPRDHTAPVPEDQGGAQVGVDGPSPVDDRADVPGLGEHQGQEGIVEQTLGHRHRDRSLAVQLTQLAGKGPTPAQGLYVDPDDDGGRGSRRHQVLGPAQVEIVDIGGVSGVGEATRVEQVERVERIGGVGGDGGVRGDGGRGGTGGPVGPLGPGTSGGGGPRGGGGLGIGGRWWRWRHPVVWTASW